MNLININEPENKKSKESLCLGIDFGTTNSVCSVKKNDKVKVNVRSSSNGKYTSISVAGKFGNPDIIIKKHKQAAKIPNIIQL